ncbi:LysR family transcriptional regulator [Necropsobacter massiliensis]|uniref:LysR family transcriptional regulator n=1 Tax=Necropsobacter massiliensis TaxID=1400001 RepID=UPI000596244E|nr:LysR family transcriptional regulator [Necropsobacter massiliensis]
MSYLSQLKTFLEVYRVRSMSQTAANLHITQPTVSLHIQSLESLMGKPLFVRQARGVLATPIADELARAIAPHIDSLENKLLSIKLGSPNGGTVHIACSPDFLHHRLLNIIAPLLDHHINLRFQLGNRDFVYQTLENDGVDLAFTASAPSPERYNFAHFMREKFYLVCSPQLIKLQDRLDPALLAQTPLLAFDENLPLVRNLWIALFRTAPTVQANLIVPDLRIIKALVIQGAGWTVLSDYHCRQELIDGRLVNLTPQALAPSNDIYLVWNKNKRLSASANYIKEYILNQNGDNAH